METLRLQGRVAIVTGAARGLGRAYAEQLAARGAHVVVNDCDQVAAREVTDCIEEHGGRAWTDTSDLLLDGAISRMVTAVERDIGPIDVIINNAGFLRDRTFRKMPWDDFRSVIDLHLMRSAELTHAVWPGMLDREYGRVVFTTSASGLYGNFGQANYAAAKLGLVGLMNSLKLEGRAKNVLVNTISPLAATRMGDVVFPDELKAYLDPEFVASIVTYLCSEACEITGEIVEAGGGRVSVARVMRTEGIVVNDTFVPEAAGAVLAEALEQRTSYECADISTAFRHIFAHLPVQLQRF